MGELNEEFEEELKARPITVEWTDFTNEQIDRRRACGKEIFDNFMEKDTTMSPEVIDMYLRCPLYLFYKSGECIKRAFGVHDTGTKRMATFTSMVIMNNYTIDGTDVEDMEPVEYWSAADKVRMACNPTPGIFADPLAFLILIDANTVDCR